MPNPTERLNAALEGRYAIERLGEGGMPNSVSYLIAANSSGSVCVKARSERSL